MQWGYLIIEAQVPTLQTMTQWERLARKNLNAFDKALGPLDFLLDGTKRCLLGPFFGGIIV